LEKGKWDEMMKRAKEMTYALLEQIRQKTGYSYKLATVKVLELKGSSPTWSKGTVTIGYDNEPEAIAHEIAHGLHEKIREAGKADCLGEDFANAIRYYVEVEIGSNSKWVRRHKAQRKNPFTSRYNTFDDFVQALTAVQNKSEFRTEPLSFQ
jgi:hypothetical protein